MGWVGKSRWVQKEFPGPSPCCRAQSRQTLKELVGGEGAKLLGVSSSYDLLLQSLGTSPPWWLQWDPSLRKLSLEPKPEKDIALQAVVYPLPLRPGMDWLPTWPPPSKLSLSPCRGSEYHLKGSYLQYPSACLLSISSPKGKLHDDRDPVGVPMPSTVLGMLPTC